MITIHAGHAPAGMAGCGAVGILDESRECRRVLTYLKSYLRAAGIAFEDITYTDAASQSRIVDTLVMRANSVKDASLHVSIHMDGWTNPAVSGSSVLYYPTSAEGFRAAEKILPKVCSALRTHNRGLKPRGDLGFLRRTAAPAVLVECCFATSPEDAEKWDVEKCARGIAEGIAEYLGVSLEHVPDEGAAVPEGRYYRVQLGAFSNRENAEKLKKELISQGYDAIIKEV